MYKIGDKVETPLGVAKVLGINGLIGTFEHQATLSTFEFPIGAVKPYRTAHEKLIEMGYEVFDEDHMGIIYRDKTCCINISKIGKSYWLEGRPRGDYIVNVPEVDLTLSRILTQYLEELNETPST